MKNKKGSGTSDQLLFRLHNKVRQNPVLVMYYLTYYDDVIKSGFGIIPKITSPNLCKPVYGIKNYSGFPQILENPGI